MTNYFLIHKSKRGSKQNFGWSKASAYSSDDFLCVSLRASAVYMLYGLFLPQRRRGSQRYAERRLGRVNLR